MVTPLTNTGLDQKAIYVKACQNILVTPLNKGMTNNNLPKGLTKHPGYTTD